MRFLKLDYEQTLHEATVNYDNQRFQDSAAAFEYLIRHCAKEGNLVDAIHFSYRAIDAWENAKLDVKKLKVWQNLGIFSLKVVSEVASATIQSTYDLPTKIPFLKLLINTLTYLNDDSNLIRVKKELANVYYTLGNEYDREINERIDYFRKAKTVSNPASDHLADIDDKIETLRLQRNAEKNKKLQTNDDY